MSDVPSLTYLVGAVVVPPTSLVLLGLLGLGWSRGRPALGRALTAFSLLGLLGLSLPLTAGWLMARIETPPLTDVRALPRDAAVVVLAGGMTRIAPEWGGDSVGLFTLQRARYGAWLARQTRLPLLVTGAPPLEGHRGEAALMRDLITQEFGVPVRWFDDQARTTAGNAREAAALLRADGITHVVLVTSAFHMPRAQRVFEHAGLRVTPAPTGYFRDHDDVFEWSDLVPSGDALRISYVALREMAAGLMYRIVDRQ